MNRMGNTVTQGIKVRRVGYIIDMTTLATATASSALVESLVSEDGSTIITEIRMSDGYINATKMCKSGGRLWADYHRQQSTDHFLQALSAKVGYHILDLVQSQRGGNHLGTWVHHQVAIHLAIWISPAFAVSVTDLVFRYLTEQIVSAPSHTPVMCTAPVDTSWESHFAFDIRVVLSGGLYANQMHGVVIDGPVTSRHIICKGGKAVDQPISGRTNDYKKLNPDNRVIFAIFAKFPGAAENRLKSLARMKGWLRTGKYSDGKNGQEFLVFLPEDAEELRRCFEIACEEDATQDVEQGQEKTKQEQEKTKQEQEKTKQNELDLQVASTNAKASIEVQRLKTEGELKMKLIDVELIKLQIELLRLQQGTSIVDNAVAQTTGPVTHTEETTEAAEEIVSSPRSAAEPDVLQSMVSVVQMPLTYRMTTGVFAPEVYERFLEECCEREMTARVFIVHLLNAFVMFYSRLKIVPNGPVQGGNAHEYGFNAVFKREFIREMSRIINASYVGLTKSPKMKGFYGVRLLTPSLQP